MKRTLTYLLLFFSFSFVNAVNSYPEPVSVAQPDGSVITIRIFGDEFFRYKTSIDGYIIAQKSDGFYYYADYNTGILRISDSRVGTPNTKSSIRTKSIPEVVVRRIREENLREHNESEVINYSASNLAEIPFYSSKNSKRVVKTPIILVQFKNVKFSVPNPQIHFNNMTNQLGYSDYGGTGSILEYYTDNLGEFYDFTFDVVDIVTLSNNMEYYMGNDKNGNDLRPREAVKEACELANRAGLDFSNYDVDKDGYVDNVFLYFAGGSEASGAGDNYLWPHQWNIYYYNLVLNGVRINSYACATEYKTKASNPSGIGTFCHEFGHILGFSDMYDTDYEDNGKSKGLWGKLDLMDSGNYNNGGNTPPHIGIIHRECIGVASIQEMEVDKNYELSPIHLSNKGYIVHSSVDNEYFLFETRAAEAWDKYIGYEGGMLVYHIDKSNNSAGGKKASYRWLNNEINCFALHECADLIEAYSYARSVKDVFFPGSKNVNIFNTDKNPMFLDWAGKSMGIAIKDIKFNGSTSRFSTYRENSIRFPKIESVKIFALQKEALVSWNYNIEGSYLWGLIYGKDSEPISSYKSLISENPRYNILDLEPDVKYKLGIFSKIADEHSDTLYYNFTTGKISSIYPFIYGMKSYFRVGDILYLKLQNITEDIKLINWFINGKAVFGGKYKLLETGEIEISVKVTYASDNSVEKITRNIKVQ